MTLAILCSGQGHQHSEMFAVTAMVPEAAPIFAAATAILDGNDPRTLVRTDVPGALHANLTGQIFCCTQALAAFSAIEGLLDARFIVAGYSVGELASWGCAGLYPPDVLLALAAQRATLMNDASGPDEGLAFVRGLRRSHVEDLCKIYRASIAIVNPGDLFVVGGTRPDLQALCEAATREGATRTDRLPVAVASHTARLAAASPLFRAELEQAKPQRLGPGIRLLSGVDGGPVLSVTEGMDRLAAQISQPINWAACLEACVEAGAVAFLELGPGNALATMVTAAFPAIKARAFDDFRSLAGVKAWIAASLS